MTDKRRLVTVNRPAADIRFTDTLYTTSHVPLNLSVKGNERYDDDPTTGREARTKMAASLSLPHTHMHTHVHTHSFALIFLRLFDTQV